MSGFLCLKNEAPVAAGLVLIAESHHFVNYRSVASPLNLMSRVMTGKKVIRNEALSY